MIASRKPAAHAQEVRQTDGVVMQDQLVEAAFRGDVGEVRRLLDAGDDLINMLL